MFKLIFVATLLAHVNCQDTAADSTCNQQPIIQQFYSSSEFPAINVEGNNRPNVAQGRPGRIGPKGMRGFKGFKVGTTANRCRYLIYLALRILLQPQIKDCKRTNSGEW